MVSARPRVIHTGGNLHTLRFHVQTVSIKNNFGDEIYYTEQFLLVILKQRAVNFNESSVLN